MCRFDRASDLEEKEREILISNRLPPELKPGKPGECDFCGEFFQRIVDGACVKCRDKYHRD